MITRRTILSLLPTVLIPKSFKKGTVIPGVFARGRMSISEKEEWVFYTINEDGVWDKMKTALREKWGDDFKFNANIVVYDNGIDLIFTEKL